MSHEGSAPQLPSSPVSEARRLLTSIEVPEANEHTHLFPRSLARLIVSLANWSLGETIGALQFMQAHNEISASECFTSISQIVQEHAWETWELAPEFDSVLPELDVAAQAVGVPSWAELRNREANSGIREVPELTKEQKEAFCQNERRWIDTIDAYEMRLLGEADEPGLAALLAADPVLYRMLGDDGDSALRSASEFIQTVPGRCPHRNVPMYAVVGGDNPAARVMALASAVNAEVA